MAFPVENKDPYSFFQLMSTSPSQLTVTVCSGRPNTTKQEQMPGPEQPHKPSDLFQRRILKTLDKAASHLRKNQQVQGNRQWAIFQVLIRGARRFVCEDVDDVIKLVRQYQIIPPCYGYAENACFIMDMDVKDVGDFTMDLFRKAMEIVQRAVLSIMDRAVAHIHHTSDDDSPLYRADAEVWIRGGDDKFSAHLLGWWTRHDDGSNRYGPESAVIMEMIAYMLLPECITLLKDRVSSHSDLDLLQLVSRIACPNQVRSKPGSGEKFVAIDDGALDMCVYKGNTANVTSYVDKDNVTHWTSEPPENTVETKHESIHFWQLRLPMSTAFAEGSGDNTALRPLNDGEEGRHTFRGDSLNVHIGVTTKLHQDIIMASSAFQTSAQLAAIEIAQQILADVDVACSQARTFLKIRKGHLNNLNTAPDASLEIEKYIEREYRDPTTGKVFPLFVDVTDHSMQMIMQNNHTFDALMKLVNINYKHLIHADLEIPNTKIVPPFAKEKLCGFLQKLQTLNSVHDIAYFHIRTYVEHGNSSKFWSLEDTVHMVEVAVFVPTKRCVWKTHTGNTTRMDFRMSIDARKPTMSATIKCWKIMDQETDLGNDLPREADPGVKTDCSKLGPVSVTVPITTQHDEQLRSAKVKLLTAMQDNMYTFYKQTEAYSEFATYLNFKLQRDCLNLLALVEASHTKVPDEWYRRFQQHKLAFERMYIGSIFNDNEFNSATGLTLLVVDVKRYTRGFNYEQNPHSAVCATILKRKNGYQSKSHYDPSPNKTEWDKMEVSISTDACMHQFAKPQACDLPQNHKTILQAQLDLILNSKSGVLCDVKHPWVFTAAVKSGPPNPDDHIALTGMLPLTDFDKGQCNHIVLLKALEQITQDQEHPVRKYHPFYSSEMYYNAQFVLEMLYFLQQYQQSKGKPKLQYHCLDLPIGMKAFDDLIPLHQCPDPHALNTSLGFSRLIVPCIGHQVKRECKQGKAKYYGSTHEIQACQADVEVTRMNHMNDLFHPNTLQLKEQKNFVRANQLVPHGEYFMYKKVGRWIEMLLSWAAHQGQAPRLLNVVFERLFVPGNTSRELLKDEADTVTAQDDSVTLRVECFASPCSEDELNCSFRRLSTGTRCTLYFPIISDTLTVVSYTSEEYRHIRDTFISDCAKLRDSVLRGKFVDYLYICDYQLCDNAIAVDLLELLHENELLQIQGTQTPLKGLMFMVSGDSHGMGMPDFCQHNQIIDNLTKVRDAPIRLLVHDLPNNLPELTMLADSQLVVPDVKWFKNQLSGAVNDLGGDRTVAEYKVCNDLTIVFTSQKDLDQTILDYRRRQGGTLQSSASRPSKRPRTESKNLERYFQPEISPMMKKQFLNKKFTSLSQQITKTHSQAGEPFFVIILDGITCYISSLYLLCLRLLQQNVSHGVVFVAYDSTNGHTPQCQFKLELHRYPKNVNPLFTYNAKQMEVLRSHAPHSQHMD